MFCVSNLIAFCSSILSCSRLSDYKCCFDTAAAAAQLMLMMMSCDVYIDEETVNGDACLSNNGPGSVPPRNPSQGPTPLQPNFPTSQVQVTACQLHVAVLSCISSTHY